MATLFLQWPPEDQAAAIAYKAAADSAYEQLLADKGYPEPDAVWGLIRLDAGGSHVVPLFGPPWSFSGADPIVEPAACLAARAGAVVIEMPEWPVIEEG